MIVAAPKNGNSTLSWTGVSVVLGLTVTVLVGGAGSFWTVLQTQFIGSDHSRLELKGELDRLREIVEVVRHTTISREEHSEFTRRLDEEIRMFQDRLRIMEATRPTTGELNRASQASDAQILELKDRVRSLEDYARSPKLQGAITPQAR